MKKGLRLAAACAVLTMVGSLAGGPAWAGPPDRGISGHGAVPGESGGHVEHGGHGRPVKPPTLPGGYKHLVVICQKNHSFDNLYGSWGSVNGQHVEGLADASATSATQVAQDGTPYSCLLQNDVNLTSPPLPGSCSDSAHAVTSAFANRPFSIDDYIAPTDTTCPALPPGTTHRTAS